MKGEFRAAVLTRADGKLSGIAIWIGPTQDTFEGAVKEAKQAVEMGNQSIVDVLQVVATVKVRRDVTFTDLREEE